MNNDNQMPLVSVVLTCYNQAKYVRDAIDSVMNSTYQNFELFISDDGSKDDSRKIILEAYNFYGKDSRIHLFLEEKNTCFKVVDNMQDYLSGKYISILGADDAFMPLKIERQVDFLENNPIYKACFTYVKINGDFSYEQIEKLENAWNQPLPAEDQDLCWILLTDNNFLNAPSMMMHREVYEELGRYDYTFRQVQDLHLWLKFLFKYNMHIIEDKLTIYGVQPDSISHSSDVDSISRCHAEDAQMYYEILRDMPEKMVLKLAPLKENEIYCKEDMMCKKLLFFLSSEKNYVRELAMRYYYENRYNSTFIRILEEKYSFTRKNIYELAAKGIYRTVYLNDKNNSKALVQLD